MEIVENYFKSISTKFSISSYPFEEFAQELFETVVFDLNDDEQLTSQFVKMILEFDWTNYTNERNGVLIRMSDILNDGIKLERDRMNFIQSHTEFKTHDYSKTDYYILMYCLRFYCPSFNTDEYRWFEKYYKYAFRKQYASERYYPEYELYVKDGECDLQDVEETAIDRLVKYFQLKNTPFANTLTEPSWSKNHKRNYDHYKRVYISRYEEIENSWTTYTSNL